MFSFLVVACLRAPPNQTIEQKYFKCEESKNLRGGNFGVGPTKRFGPTEAACTEAEWVEVDKAEFKRLATSWYEVDWSKEIPFWQ